MAHALDRSLITMGRARDALRWPAYLCFEFVSPWQEVSKSRTDLFGWDLDTSVGGSPSKRYWTKVTRVAEEMKACWNLEREEGIPASPTEGPTGAVQEHGTIGNWSYPDENGANRSCAPKAPAASSPVQYFPGAGNYSSSPDPTSTTPAAGWDARITEVMDREEGASLTNPLEGWPMRINFGRPLWAAAFTRIPFSRKA